MIDRTDTNSVIGMGDNPLPSEFRELSRNYTRPVLLTGVVKEWAAHEIWSFEYMHTILGDLPVCVSHSPKGYFDGDPDLGFLGRFQYMTFGDFCRSLASEIPQRFYLTQQSLDSKGFCNLKKDMPAVPYFDREKHISTNIWIGGGGIVSPLHNDAPHNLFAQIRGRKRFTLYSPANSNYLYAYPPASKIPHMSQVNVDAVDRKRFPLFSHAQAQVLVVEPGDLLFLPSGWWHHVYSITKSISINFWSAHFAAAE